MLETSALKYRYGSGPELVFPDIFCKRGEHRLIIGQSGCGKTTLLHLLGGLRTPVSGDVIIDQTNLKSLKSSELDAFRGKHVGIIFQRSHFVSSLTVAENLMLAQQLAGQGIDRKRVVSLLERLGIAHKEDKKTQALSQGEQQRVAIARAIVNSPSLILADEPTSALDDHNTQEVVNLLLDQANLVNASLLVVTHDNRLKHYFTETIAL